MVVTAAAAAAAEPDALRSLEDIDAFTQLVEKLEHVDVLFENNWTLLVHACRSGNIEAAQVLLERGANVNHTTRDGFSPLIAAVTHGSVELVQALVDEREGIKVDLEAPWGITALIRACGDGRTAVVWTLLDAGADVNKTSTAGDSPLMAAAGHGHLEIVQLLISRGANVQWINRQGFTALSRAVFNRHTAIVQALCERGANPSLKSKTNKHQLTALELGKRQDIPEILAALQRAVKQRSLLSVARENITWEVTMFAVICIVAVVVGSYYRYQNVVNLAPRSS